jgi:hypothetical protein
MRSDSQRSFGDGCPRAHSSPAGCQPASQQASPVLVEQGRQGEMLRGVKLRGGRAII